MFFTYPYYNDIVPYTICTGLRVRIIFIAQVGWGARSENGKLLLKRTRVNLKKKQKYVLISVLFFLSPPPSHFPLPFPNRKHELPETYLLCADRAGDGAGDDQHAELLV